MSDAPLSRFVGGTHLDEAGNPSYVIYAEFADGARTLYAGHIVPSFKDERAACLRANELNEEQNLTVLGNLIVSYRAGRDALDRPQAFARFQDGSECTADWLGSPFMNMQAAEHYAAQGNAKLIETGQQARVEIQAPEAAQDSQWGTF